MWSEVTALFRDYMGVGLIVIWYMLSLIYLWIQEKRKYVRILFLYLPIILLLIYFNPLFAELVYGMAGNEIYYRILWLLPVTVVVAYTSVCIYGELERRHQGLRAGLFALCMAGTLAASGSFIYSSPLFSKAENIYHMPDSVVHICDAINVPGREVMAVFPIELVQYVRQYSPVTCMPYGREVTVERWNHSSALRDEMEQEIINMEQLVFLTRRAGCHYVIFREGQKLRGNPEDYGWIRFGETDGYVIYRDPFRELSIPGT